MANIPDIFKLSFSNQNKYQTYIFEINKRDNLSEEDILNKIKYRDILNSQNIEGRKKGNELLKRLFELRYPITSGKAKIKQESTQDEKTSKKAEHKELIYIPELIYLEKQVKDLPFTQHILANPFLEKSRIIEVDNIDKLIKETLRQAQGKPTKKDNQPLLLAKQKGDWLEKCPGTKEHICCNYFTLRLAIGCPFDCTYCFLQSYTNNSFLTVYTNIEDLLEELNSKSTQPIRIGTGEYTDSFALEHLTNFNELHISEILKNKNITLELKTKSSSANIDKIANIFGDHTDQLVFGFSLNPQTLVNSDEKDTSSLKERIDKAKILQEKGFTVAFHFDPIIHTANWENLYQEVIQKIKENIDPKKIAWISLGTFRFTPALKPLIKTKFPRSKMIYGELFPGPDGKMRYSEEIRKYIYTKMLSWLGQIKKDLPIYFCMESKEIWQELAVSCENTSSPFSLFQ